MKLDRDKLMRARELLGYGVEKTAEEAGVSKNSVLRAEHEGDIRPVTARKIAGALGVRVADLLGKAGASEKPETLTDKLLRAPATRMPIEEFSDEALKAMRHVLAGGKPSAYFVEEDPEWLGQFATWLIEENARLKAQPELPLEPGYDVLLKQRRFPSEQIAAFLAQNERDEDFIRRELEKMSTKDFREALLASPAFRRIREYYRETDTEASAAPRSESA